jgi:hypothetical protein
MTAIYKYPQILQQSADAAFDQVTGVGKPTPYSGIYRCTGCGLSIAANRGNPMPPQNHHQHSQGQGPISWQLIVMSTHT